MHELNIRPINGTRLLQLLILLILLLLSVGMYAAPYSAELWVLQPGVDFLRYDTNQWIPLRKDSNFPISDGDKIRTDSTGRVLIDFAGQGQVLLLHDSAYQIMGFDLEDNDIQVQAYQEGTAIHQINEVGNIRSYELETNVTLIHQPATSFAVWSTPIQEAVTVAVGEVGLRYNDTDFTVPQGSGFLGEGARMDLLELEAPYHISQLIAIRDGCRAQVSTQVAETMYVLQGDSSQFLPVSVVVPQEDIYIMGMNESEGWYRIHHYNGFGWLPRWAVEENCPDLPQLADGAFEAPYTLFQIRDLELPITTPFFGSPALTWWVYRRSDPLP